MKTAGLIGNYAHGFQSALSWDRRFPGQDTRPGGPWYDRKGGTPEREAEHHAWHRGFAEGRAVAEGRMG